MAAGCRQRRTRPTPCSTRSPSPAPRRRRAGSSHRGQRRPAQDRGRRPRARPVRQHEPRPWRRAGRRLRACARRPRCSSTSCSEATRCPWWRSTRRRAARGAADALGRSDRSRRPRPGRHRHGHRRAWTQPQRCHLDRRRHPRRTRRSPARLPPWPRSSCSPTACRTSRPGSPMSRPRSTSHYAIGLGTAANTSAAELQTLSGNHGGYLLVTGPITGTNQFALEKYFLQILSGIANAEVVLDPAGPRAGPGAAHPVHRHRRRSRPRRHPAHRATAARPIPAGDAERRGDRRHRRTRRRRPRRRRHGRLLPPEAADRSARQPTRARRDVASHRRASRRQDDADRVRWTERRLPYSLVVHAWTDLARRPRCASPATSPA